MMSINITDLTNATVTDLNEAEAANVKGGLLGIDLSATIAGDLEFASGIVGTAGEAVVSIVDQTENYVAATLDGLGL